MGCSPSCPLHPGTVASGTTALEGPAEPPSPAPAGRGALKPGAARTWGAGGSCGVGWSWDAGGNWDAGGSRSAGWIWDAGGIQDAGSTRGAGGCPVQRQPQPSAFPAGPSILSKGEGGSPSHPGGPGPAPTESCAPSRGGDTLGSPQHQLVPASAPHRLPLGRKQRFCSVFGSAFFVALP